MARAKKQATPDARVVATRTGYYGHKRRREGEVFVLEEPEDFSDNWMKWAEGVPDEIRSSARRTIGDTVVSDSLDEQKSFVGRAQATVAGEGEEGHELAKANVADKEQAAKGGPAPARQPVEKEKVVARNDAPAAPLAPSTDTLRDAARRSAEPKRD